MRNVYQRRIGIALTATALVALTGCGGGTKASTGNGGAVDPNASLTVVTNGVFAEFDPAFARLGAYPYLYPVYDRLLIPDVKSGLPSPSLATNFTMSSDGKQVALTLRDDVTFHDGTKLDATVVKGNLDRLRTATGSVSAPELASIASVDVVDPTHVTINLSAPNPLLPLTLTGRSGMVVSAAGLKATGGELKTRDYGSGPYEVDSVTATGVAYKRASGTHWQKGVGLAKSLTVTFVGDPQTRLNGLKSGQYDLIRADPDQLNEGKTLAAGNQFDMVNLHAKEIFYAFFNHATFPDPEVRKALRMALDVNLLGETLFRGGCEPIGQPFPKGVSGNLPDAKSTYYAPDQAKKILEDKGWAGKTIKVFYASDSPMYARVTQAMQEMWTKVGLKVELVPKQQSLFIAEWGKGAQDVMPMFFAGETDAGEYVRDVYVAPRFNPGGVDPQLTQLHAKANVLPLGSAERNAAYQELAKYMIDSTPHAELCQLQSPIFIYSSKVVGVDAMPGANFSGLLDPRYLGKRSN